MGPGYSSSAAACLVSVTESAVLCQLVDTSVATKILQFRKLNEDSSVLENISEDSSESKILCRKYLQGFSNFNNRVLSTQMIPKMLTRLRYIYRQSFKATIETDQ